MTRDLYFCGDIHGEIKTLVWKLSKQYEIRNADVIVLGDFGVGFDKTLEDTYLHIEPKLNDIDVTIYAIRGNHDDPKYFNGPDRIDKKRLKLLEDHKVYSICDRSIYVIGGACSTDISARLGFNNDPKNQKKGRVCWWEDEPVIQKLKDLPERVDIIISHTAPINFDPIVKRYPETPIWYYEEIVSERRYLSKVLEEVNADFWFYGHFHNHYSGSFSNLIWKGLDIMELYPAPEHIEHNPQINK